MSGCLESVQWNVYVHRLDLILYSFSVSPRLPPSPLSLSVSLSLSLSLSLLAHTEAWQGRFCHGLKICIGHEKLKHHVALLLLLLKCLQKPEKFGDCAKGLFCEAENVKMLPQGGGERGGGPGPFKTAVLGSQDPFNS